MLKGEQASGLGRGGAGRRAEPRWEQAERMAEREKERAGAGVESILRSGRF